MDIKYKATIALMALFLISLMLVIFRRKVRTFFNNKWLVIFVYGLLLMVIIALRMKNVLKLMAETNVKWGWIKTELAPTDLCPFLMIFGPIVMMNTKWRENLSLTLGVWAIFASTLSLSDFIQYDFTTSKVNSGFLMWFLGGENEKGQWITGTRIFMHWTEFLIGITFLTIAKPFKKKSDWFKPLAFIAIFLLLVFVVATAFGISKNTTLVKDGDLLPGGEYFMISSMFGNNIHLARFIFYIFSVGIVYLLTLLWYFIKKVDVKYINNNPRGLFALPISTELKLKKLFGSYKKKYEKWNKLNKK